MLLSVMTKTSLLVGLGIGCAAIFGVQGATAAGEVETSAKASLREWHGSDGVTHQLQVEVEIKGADAKNAYAIGPHRAEPVILDGKKVAVKEEIVKSKGFDLIDRTKTGIFAEHPKEGVAVVIDYEKVPEDSKTIEAVKGSVDILVGDTKKSIVLDKLLTRPKGRVKDAALEKAGLKLSFERHEFGDDAQVGVSMNADTIGFAGLELIGPDGKPVPNVGTSSGTSGNRVDQGISTSRASLKNATLRINFYEDSRKITLPFEIKKVSVEKK